MSRSDMDRFRECALDRLDAMGVERPSEDLVSYMVELVDGAWSHIDPAWVEGFEADQELDARVERYAA